MPHRCRRPKRTGCGYSWRRHASEARPQSLRARRYDLAPADARRLDQLQLQRLKKRKLALKDQIKKIESELLPDIIA